MGQNDNPSGTAGSEKVEVPKDYSVRENVKVSAITSEATALESSSTSSLSNNPITTSAANLDEVAGASSSPPTATEQEQQQPVPSELTNPQTGGQGVVIVGRSSSEDTGHHAPVGGAGGGTNGGGKKKPGRGKGKMILSFVEVTPDNVVKCILVTKNDVRINFQFSRKFDETKAIFKKLVSHHTARTILVVCIYVQSKNSCKTAFLLFV